MLWLFRILFTISILGAGVALFFFFAGLADGSVSSLNAVLWAGLLAVTGGVPIGGYLLHRKNLPWIALGLLSITALPAVLGLVVLIVVIVFPPRWN